MQILAGIEERIPVLIKKYFKKFPGLSEEIIRKINECDPTGEKALYTEWLIREAIDRVSGKNFGFCLSIRSLLEDFDRAKKLSAFRKAGYSFDINAYSWSSLYDIRTPLNKMIYDFDSQQKIKEGRKYAKMVYTSEGWSIWKCGDGDPEKAVEAVCALAHGTGWCVQKKGDAEAYLRSGPLYVFMEGNKRRALYSPSDRELRDPQNQLFKSSDEVLAQIKNIWREYRGSNTKSAKRKILPSVQIKFEAENSVFTVFDIRSYSSRERSNVYNSLLIYRPLGKTPIAIYYADTKKKRQNYFGIYSSYYNKIFTGNNSTLPEDTDEQKALYAKTREMYAQMKNQKGTRSAAPHIDQTVQRTYWRLGDALAKALHSPDGGGEGDPQWTVTGKAVGGWAIEHPNLPIVKGETGARKDVLLQLHISEQNGRYLVIAQNKVVGPESHSSPRALVVATEDTPPGPDWDVEAIAHAAATFFKEQKKDLVQVATALTPTAPMGQDAGGGEQGGGGPILSSLRVRKNRVAARLRRIATAILSTDVFSGWIDRQGKVYPIPNLKHAEWVKDNTPYESPTEAIAHGFVRVTFLIYEFYPKAISPATRSAMEELIRNDPSSHTFISLQMGRRDVELMWDDFASNDYHLPDEWFQ